MPLSPESRNKIQKLLKTVIVILIVLVSGQLVFKIAVVPNIVLKKIMVDSEIDLSDEEIRSIAGIDEGLYYYKIDAQEIQKRLEEYPPIRRASVEKIFPDKLQLYLYEREAVALSLLNVQEKSVPVAIDKEGVIFESGRDLVEWDLPVITGIRFSSVELGTSFPEALEPLFKDLNKLKGENVSLYNLISEINVEKRGEEGYDLILYLQNFETQARVGRELNSDVLTNIIMVFEVLEVEELIGKIGEVDFRSREIVYRLKEEV